MYVLMLTRYTPGMRIFFCLLLLTGVAFARDLPCKSLLESLPATRFNELTSFEATFSFKENNSTLTLRQIEDVTNGRTYYETTESETGELVIARYEGETGTLETNGQIEVAPPRAELEPLTFFDVFLSQQIFARAELLSCDGQQSIETPEGTLEGEVITVKIEDDEGQLLFDTEGHIIGWKSERDIGVFENEYQDDLLVKSSFRIYVKPEETASVDTATLENTMTFELVSYDQPVDESLFSNTGNLECEGLLEVFKNEPEFTSLETSTTYTQDPSQPSDYRVVDFTGQRIYWEVTLNGVKTIYRLVNGEVTGVTEVDGKQEATEVLDYIRISLESTFSSSASFRDLADKAVVLSCDGERSYSDDNGEIVRGQQITVADKTNLEGDSAKLLFDDAGDFIGNYVDRPADGQDILLLSLDRKKDETGITVEVTTVTYIQNSDSFELINKTTTKTLSYNQRVDETLFEP
jgi:hypothetical protein